MPRIVSLIASATEIVSALGFAEQIVGRSHECDYPEPIKRLPICTAPKFDVHGSSSEIDGRVKALLRDATSVYRVDADLLRELCPDVIVTQAHCEVCAVSLKDVEKAVCTWLDSRPQLVSLEPNCLEDVWGSIQRVAEALKVPERGRDVVARLRQRVAAIAERSRALPHRPIVACLEWLDPLMAAGNWMPELVDLAGGENLFGSAGKHAPWMTWEQLQKRDPEIIVALPCGYDMATTRREMSALTQREEWPKLQAVRTNRVYLTDGNQFFNRPGPRLVESLEILAEVLHPTGFDFGHRGTGWEPL